MNGQWNQSRLQQYIDDKIEERLTLDYKASGALKKCDNKKKEITKDVSAMANSDGGLIIYGIKEDNVNKHLPKAIDPINRGLISKEWLEQIINNIQPRISNIIIHPVTIDSSLNDVVYVVEIPKSTTAHQATDKKYYRRFNFQSVPMDDYEIRDIMGRYKHPIVDLKCKLLIISDRQKHYIPNEDSLEPSVTEYISKTPSASLRIEAFNSGHIYAKYLNICIKIPSIITPEIGFDENIHQNQHKEYYKENIDDLNLKPLLPQRTQQWDIELDNKVIDDNDFNQLDEKLSVELLPPAAKVTACDRKVRHQPGR